MVTRTKDQNTLSLGEWNGICDVCGFKFKSCDLKKRWDGFMVCAEDWEPRHPSDFFRMPQPEPSIPWTRADTSTDPSAGDNTDIKGNTFPPTENTDATGQGTKPDSDADGLVEGDFLLDGEAVDETVSKG